MLRVADLHAGYPGVPVLRGIGLDVQAGEVVAVLGANGAGKTTLNKVLSGLLVPDKGQVVFDGAAIAGARPDKIVAAGLIHVPEGRKIFPNMSVRENLEVGSVRRGRPRRAHNMARVFDLFPRLAERSRQRAGTLSGGEQQMLAIGRGLMGEPRLLILDEPSLGLSPLLVEEVFDLIRHISVDGLAVLLVEQNVVQSLETAQRAYVIENGGVVLDGPCARLLDDPTLAQAYFGSRKQPVL
ncbi:MAG: ABC transporter ATP-binding protein [Hyphomicrobiaceae bacterium]